MKVLVVGVGALGTEVIKTLVLLGVKDICLVDCDRIEMSNLSRQMFFRHDHIGLFKAETAATVLQKTWPWLRIEYRNSPVEELAVSFFEQFTIVVCSVDSVKTRRWLNSLIVGDLRKPLIEGGTEGLLGHARLIDSASACVECTIDFYPQTRQLPCGQYYQEEGANEPMASVCTTNAIIGAIMAKMLLDHSGSFVLYNGTEAVFMDSLKIDKRKDCFVCSYGNFTA